MWFLSRISLAASSLFLAVCAETRAGSAPVDRPQADALHVDPVAGDDAADGRMKPVKTIARAMRLAQPGVTIHLAPAVYHETADFTNKSGEPGRPITLDGHGAVLEGSEPVTEADWESLGNGVYRKVKLLPRIDAAMIGRWFFLWDGKMNHMGRTSKGPSAPLKQPADLQPGEWTYVAPEDAFYLRIPPEQSLDAAHIRYPARTNGVAFGGKGAHLVVRNLVATHVYNDGYNVHGTQRDLVLENIGAIECGDDGFSAHEDGECRIDGFVSIANSTGLCDTVSSVTHYRNVYISGCLGYDVFFIGNSPHSIENGVVESNAARAFEASQHFDRVQRGWSDVRLSQVLIRRVGDGPAEVRVNRSARVDADRCTFLGLNIQVAPGGAMMAERCTISGNETKPELLLGQNSLWRGEFNRLDLAAIRYGGVQYTSQKFAEFQKLTGTERTSGWPELPKADKAVGVDEAVVTEVTAMATRIKAWWEAHAFPGAALTK